MFTNNKTFRKIWKSFWEPVLSFPLLQWIVALAFATMTWFAYFTSRKVIKNKEVFLKYKKSPAIFVFWHGRSLMLAPIMRMGKMRGYCIASQHKDGRMMAKFLRLFGLKAIYGSTSKGGVSVLRQGIKILNDVKCPLCLSPDGPGGPSLRVQDGALYFAKMSGAPIIPVCFSSSGAWFQKRWDRYLLSLPFSKIVCKIGEPIFIDRRISSENFEEQRKKLEKIMVKQMRNLDSEFDLFRVEQDLTASEFKKKMREAKK